MTMAFADRFCVKLNINANLMIPIFQWKELYERMPVKLSYLDVMLGQLFLTPVSCSVGRAKTSKCTIMLLAHPTSLTRIILTRTRPFGVKTI
jgi:hypothetical protein